LSLQQAAPSPQRGHWQPEKTLVPSYSCPTEGRAFSETNSSLTDVFVSPSGPGTPGSEIESESLDLSVIDVSVQEGRKVTII
jgi:hypothetical protein